MSRRRWSGRKNICAVLLSIALVPLLPSSSFPAEFVQQGDKLVGTGREGGSLQGFAVALSADGSTALIGGYGDNSLNGAAWVFVRNGTAWTQQGDKLVGTGGVRFMDQGFSVALSADGNTALSGGHGDDNYAGATWAFSRRDGVWTQQGDKLRGTGASKARAQQGISVALSGDGNTGIIGAYGVDKFTGAAWIVSRRDGVWSQQGGRLVGDDAIGWAHQGWSVALSSDGSTALLGGYADDEGKGAVWVYTRSGETWTRQAKLVGANAIGASGQGYSVALSGDGNTAVIGGYGDDNFTGAIWVFTRRDGIWSQQGSKLVGSGAVGPARQGQSVAISGDGNTAVVGGFADDDLTGAAWVFSRRDGVWTQDGGKIVGKGAAGPARQGRAVAISADGRVLMIGGFGDDANSGAAWVFVRKP